MNRITLRSGIVLFIFQQRLVSEISLSKLAEENGEIIFHDSAKYFASRNEKFYETLAERIEGEKNSWRDYRREFDEVDSAKSSIATVLIFMNVSNPNTTIIITRK